VWSWSPPKVRRKVGSNKGCYSIQKLLILIEKVNKNYRFPFEKLYEWRISGKHSFRKKVPGDSVV
jgi:hypothetical protein